MPGDSTVYQLLERENGGEREIARESDTEIASVWELSFFGIDFSALYFEGIN